MKGCNNIHSNGDAELEIVTTAIRMSEIYSTTLIGEDTDLLILLQYLYSKEKNGKRIQFSDKEESKGNLYDISHTIPSVQKYVVYTTSTTCLYRM